MKRTLSRIAALLILMILAVPQYVLADGPPGFGSGVTDVNGGGAGVPLDGGLGLLLAAGIGYGVKRYVSSLKPAKDSDGSSHDSK